MSKLGRALRDMASAVREDHAMLRHYDGKYGDADRRAGSTPAFATLRFTRDLVTRVGFQMLAACRAMRFCADAGIPLAPQLVSRLIRHAYGSDVHWDATIEPGVVVVHGMGIAVSPAAHIGRGAILFQHVTLGAGVDPESRASGAPRLEQDVHVGPGSTLVGPITVGARSKVSANCFVRTSVPADSLVQAPQPVVTTRARAGQQASGKPD